MKFKYAIGLVLVLLLAMAGCSRKVAPSISTVVKDSVHTTEVVKYVTKPADTVRIEKRIECNQAGEVKPFVEEKKQGLLTERIEVKADGEIKAECWCDSLLEERNKTIDRLHQEKTTITKVVYEHIPHWYDIAARWISGIVLLIVGGAIFLKIYKPKFL